MQPLRPDQAPRRAVGRALHSKLHGLRFLALRFFSVWGPGQRPDLALEVFRRRIIERKTKMAPFIGFGGGWGEPWTLSPSGIDFLFIINDLRGCQTIVLSPLIP